MIIGDCPNQQIGRHFFLLQKAGDGPILKGPALTENSVCAGTHVMAIWQDRIFTGLYKQVIDFVRDSACQPRLTAMGLHTVPSPFPGPRQSLNLVLFSLRNGRPTKSFGTGAGRPVLTSESDKDASCYQTYGMHKA